MATSPIAFWKPIRIGGANATSANSTSFTVPSKAVVRDAFIHVITGATCNVAFGRTADTYGYLTGIGVTSTGVATITSQEVGALLKDQIAATSGDLRKADTGAGGKTLTWTESASKTGLVADVWVEYIDLQAE